MAECTIYDKLRYISETKDLIKAAIESQDVEVLESDTFRKYAEYITEIRKVSSVNGMQGDVVITLEDLGGITIDALNGYATEQWVEDKGYITGFTIPEEYVTEDDLTNYYTKEEVDEAIDNVDVTEQLQNYYTKEEIEGKKYLTEVPSEYITEEELADTLDIITEMGEDITSLEENKQDKLTQGTGIKIENNVISLDYSYDLFEVVTELPTENISDNKIYLVKDTDGGEENAFVEYIYVDGKFEEVGKFKTTVDLTGYATEQWVSEQGFLTEVPEEYVTDTDLGEALDGYATEQWVEDKKYLTEHQSLEDYYTKNDIDSKGYITAIPDTYVTEDELSTQLSDKVTQTALNEAINEVGNVIEVLEGDIAKKQDILVSGTNIKTINGQPILGSGDIVIEGGSVDLDLFEVVTELPTENINENKIYLMKDPTASNRVISVEGMTPATDYAWDEKDTYIQDGEATIDGTTINNDKRTRITIKGFEGDFEMFVGLSFAPMDIIAEQLYIQVQSLNEDTSNGRPDNWLYRKTAQVGEGVSVSWTPVGLGTLDPTKEYFFDVWTNGGQASVMNVDFYLPSYIAVPQSEVSASQFIEYIYNNGEWEELGKSIKMVDEKAYRSIGVDPNGSDGQSYAIFSKADGSGDVLEVAKINGKTLIGWKAQELSLAETKEITQEEYDALTPEDNVLYIITDAEEVGIPTKVSQLENDSKFISEGNLKTINENSLIGEGDITIEGVTKEDLFYNEIAGVAYPYINFVNASDNKIYLGALWENESNATGSKLPYTLYFKTINDQTIFGEGDITIEGGDMTNYYTKEEIDALIGGVETKITEINDMI